MSKLTTHKWTPTGMNEEKTNVWVHIQEAEKALEAHSQASMGVSAWRRHGKKYGYDKYFEEALVKRVKGMKTKSDPVGKGCGNHNHVYECCKNETLNQVVSAIKDTN